MTKRIIVAVIAIPILLLIIFFAPLWVLGIVVGGIAACSAWELLRCAEENLRRRMQVIAALCAFCIPLGCAFFAPAKIYETALFLLFAYLFCELMLSFRKEKTMDFETVPVVLLGAGIMPILISAIVRLRLRDHGSVFVLLPFIAAFSCDSGAYFVGCAIGKHKLAPHLSPNKTVEGSFGGFAAAILLMLLYGLVLKAAKFEVNFTIMAVYGFLSGLACQLGDLSFSAVKRLCGVKDYGNLIPGHGGMLDRFDSMFWTAALMELLVSGVPAIVK